MTAWIRMIGDEEADEALRQAFDRVRAPAGDVGNVMQVHGLRLHTMLGHAALYRSVLHDADNRLPDWLLEVVGSYVSLLNRCDYSFTNHFANARHLIGDAARAEAILAALRADRPEDVFDGRPLAALRYARKLTLTPGDMVRADVEALHAAGFDDGEILEINQVASYFAYANRLLNGLGVTLAGDIVGYYATADTPPEP
jgi:uncharacterized peroxidase-related enzyme